jgi:hypothetical protein
LNEGVVQLSVGVAKLVVFDEEFKTFGQSWFGAMVFGEGRHELWVFNNEGGVEALSL